VDSTAVELLNLWWLKAAGAAAKQNNTQESAATVLLMVTSGAELVTSQLLHPDGKSGTTWC